MRLSDYPKVCHTRCAILALLGLVVTGCGKSNLPQTIQVSGTVSFAGGICPGPGRIRFLPVDISPNRPRRPGRATFDSDGAFHTTSFRSGDGLVPGTYRVQLECWEVEPANGMPGVSFLPADFLPRDLEVKSDQGAVTYDIEVPSHR